MLKKDVDSLNLDLPERNPTLFRGLGVFITWNRQKTEPTLGLLLVDCRVSRSAVKT